MEHAVIVHLSIDLPANTAGTLGDELDDLEDALTLAVQETQVGELDGREVGESDCVFFLYGQDADELFNSIESVLKKSRLSRHAVVVKRYGPADDPRSKEVTVEL